MRRLLASLRTVFTPDRLGWIQAFALLVGASVVSNWLQWPLGKHRELPLFWAVLVVGGGWWLLSLEKVEGWLGRFNLDGAGGWRTTRTERIRRLGPIPFFAVAALGVGELGWELWRIGDAIRVTGAMLIVVALVALMVRYAIRTLRVRVELRIDEAGVFAPAWRRTYAWSDIAHAVQPQGPRELQLVLTPAGAEAAGRAALLTLPLAPTGLRPNEALIALRAVRPELPIEPWTSNGVVLPIRGATEVPDTVEVTTYG